MQHKLLRRFLIHYNFPLRSHKCSNSSLDSPTFEHKWQNQNFWHHRAFGILSPVAVSASFSERGSLPLSEICFVGLSFRFARQIDYNPDGHRPSKLICPVLPPAAVRIMLHKHYYSEGVISLQNVVPNSCLNSMINSSRCLQACVENETLSELVRTCYPTVQCPAQGSHFSSYNLFLSLLIFSLLSSIILYSNEINMSRCTWSSRTHIHLFIITSITTYISREEHNIKESIYSIFNKFIFILETLDS